MPKKTRKWRGIYKVIEECGELLCELGKVGPFPHRPHPDGKGDLVLRIENEAADVLAATTYLIDVNKLDAKRIQARAEVKLKQFHEWGLTGLGEVRNPK